MLIHRSAGSLPVAYLSIKHPALSKMAGSILVMLAIVLAWLAPARADETAPGNGFKMELAQIRVVDEFGRLYQAPSGTVWLAARLSRGDNQSPAIKDLQTLEVPSGLSYNVNPDAEHPENDWQFFTLNPNGTADAQFVIFDDTSKNPINYDLALFEKTPEGKKQQLAMFKTPYEAGGGIAARLLRIGIKRPLITAEKAMLAGFVFITLLISYLLLGRELFRRMLFHKRMEVESALNMSNGLVLIFAVLTGVVGICIYLYPYVYWDSIYGIYAAATLGYVALLVLTYAIGALMTRA